MQKIENTMFCTECGSKNSKVNAFCLNCGNELEQEKLEYININTNKSVSTNINKKINSSLNDLNTEDMNLFISKKTEYYNQKFNQITETGNKRTWNWAAFFLNIYWLLYRKMYVQGGIMILISLATASISSVIPFLGIILGWGVNIAFAMYANSIYLDHIHKKLYEINSMEYEAKESMIMKKGGTNIVIPMILLGIYLLVIVGIVVFVGAIFGSIFGSGLYY